MVKKVTKPIVKKSAAAPDVIRMPLGVYFSRERYSAIAIKHTTNGVWYLTFSTGMVLLEHCSEARFIHLFPLMNPDYPMRRAIRKYHESFFKRDEKTEKVLRMLLR